jgi:mannosyl-oligosaccharide alpha-1,2-mannosidase
VSLSSKFSSQSLDNPSVFETTIRYIGGLLASYELSGAKYPVLVAKAKEVADKLTFAWVGVRVTFPQRIELDH